MTTFIAFLRAINVGGTGILPMKELSALCVTAGFQDPRTYIQSGNVVFRSTLAENKVQAALEQALAIKMKRPIDVFLRTTPELRSIVESNPFPDQDPARVTVAFLHRPAPPELLAGMLAPGGEQLSPGARELYIYYPKGMGKSRFKLSAKLGPATVRNINTLTKLLALSASLAPAKTQSSP